MRPQEVKKPDTQQVEVIRPFFGTGQVLHEVGTRPTLPMLFAIELKASRKVRFLSAEEVAEAEAQASAKAAAKPEKKSKGDGGGGGASTDKKE